MMKQIILTIFMFLPLIGFTQTQTEMNIEAAKDYQKVDKELNSVYQQIMKKIC